MDNHQETGKDFICHTTDFPVITMADKDMVPHLLN